MKLAAIDIGSNAVRLLIEKVSVGSDGYAIEKVAFFRIPIRLGADVFSKNRIGTRNAERLESAMKAFWYLMDVHDVEQITAAAEVLDGPLAGSLGLLGPWPSIHIFTHVFAKLQGMTGEKTRHVAFSLVVNGLKQTI